MNELIFYFRGMYFVCAREQVEGMMTAVQREWYVSLYLLELRLICMLSGLDVDLVNQLIFKKDIIFEMS